MRAIRPEDKPRLLAAFEGLSDESRYRRFFTPLRELTPATLAYLTEVDHHDHEAVVALPEAEDRLVGVARYVRERPGGDVAEAAITVIDDWQGRGLGRLLLRRLAARARQEGIRRFSAVVKVENPVAVDLLRGLGRSDIARDGNEFTLLIDLPERGVGRTLARALRAAAAGTFTMADSVAHRVAGTVRPPRP